MFEFPSICRYIKWIYSIDSQWCKRTMKIKKTDGAGAKQSNRREPGLVPSIHETCLD